MTGKAGFFLRFPGIAQSDQRSVRVDMTVLTVADQVMRLLDMARPTGTDSFLVGGRMVRVAVEAIELRRMRAG